MIYALVGGATMLVGAISALLAWWLVTRKTSRSRGSLNRNEEDSDDLGGECELP